jgi:hypothetical protein
MKTYKHGMTDAVREHLAQGGVISRLEAWTLFGVQNLAQVVSGLRKQGFVIESRKVPYARVLVRVNEHAVFHPPKNLPIKEIQLTEYWMNR